MCIRDSVTISLRGSAAAGANSRNLADFAIEAITGSDGEYELKRRAPPGRYVLTASRRDGNVLRSLLDVKSSELTADLQNRQSFEYSPNLLSR